MKKFFTNIALFLFPLFLFSILLDVFFTQKVKNSNKCEGEFEVWNDIYGGKLNCELSIYGSSKAWVQINPEILEDSLGFDVYNFGIDGHNFWLQNLRHVEYQKHNSKPKIIIHSVDIFTLQKRKDLYNMSQFLPYMIWNIDIYKSTAAYKGFSFVDYFIPLIRYRHNTSLINSLVTKDISNNQPFRHKGFKGMKREWNNDLNNAKMTTGSYAIEIDSSSVILYEQFLKKCHSENIEVILIYTPEYIDGQRFTSNRKEIIDLYNNLAKKHGLLFLDYSSNYLCYIKKYFYNSLHLNGIGADIFTKILASDIKKARMNKT